MLEGCGSHFFFYIRDEQLQKIKEKPLVEIPEKDVIKKDIRKIARIINDSSEVCGIKKRFIHIL